MKRICLDFDGVVHNYISPWVSPAHIEDAPVDGAFQAIQQYLDSGWAVAIHSARSHQPEGLAAMKEWFLKHGFENIDSLEFPEFKPPSILYVDDRGYHFTGTFPSLGYLESFLPWNRHE